jgi:hypothetical protein
MKNLHLIPTDNYSPLVHSTSKYGGYFLSKYYSPMKHMGDSFQHIYITSDEEIKEGERGLSINDAVYTHFNHLGKDYGKRIILTTDQDLINEGVQAIDDKFLEWFVKNPSCEEVEVGYGWIRLTETDNEGYWVSIPDKRFEMQQEEPKQENCCTPVGQIKRYVDCVGCDRKPKQETLGEALKKELEFIHSSARNMDFDLGFKTGSVIGAKRQAERMYSEGQSDYLIEALKEIESFCDNQNPTHENIWRVANNAIEQFKKK